ncbi:MAG: 4Fe-4S binding protein [Candidatus Rokubacteria bacterium]|nr:4Fe-4S binding protein [Candidatus Rokubacteria bacterium]
MIARLLGAALVLLPVAAWAHGDHGGAKALGETSLVTVQGYQVELLSRPSPLALGQESELVAKIFKNSPLRPISGGRVLVGLAPVGTPPELNAATETTWAGNYVVALTPARTGMHQIRVVMEELDGRIFAPPLVVDFQVGIGRAPGMGVAVWTLLALVTGIALVSVYAATLKARIKRPAALNLLEIPWLRQVLTSPAFAPALQIPVLLLTAAVVLIGLVDVQDGAVNLATKLTWILWWPGIVFSFVLVGRLWCVMCPFGALNEWTARATGTQRMFPKALRHLWLATFAFVLLTWADEQLGVIRSPRMTAWLILFLGVASVLTGLFFARRTFCRYLCPITGLQGLYSMIAPVELRVDERARCRKECDQDCYRGNEKGAGCPMFEFPMTMDRNTYCNLCFECVKACPPHNLALRIRALGRDLWTSGRRVLDEAYLAVILVGLTFLVTAQMLTAWSGWVSGLARWLPGWVRAGLRPVTYLGLVESAVLLGGALVVVPLVVLAGAALAQHLVGVHRLGLRRTFVIFGYVLIPVGLAMHLAHNLGHLLLEGGGIIPAVQRAVALYTPFSLGEPDWQILPLAAEPVVELIQAIFVVGFFVLSLVAGRRLSIKVYPDPRVASRAMIPLVALSLIFTAIGVILLNQPMGMRHGM